MSMSAPERALHVSGAVRFQIHGPGRHLIPSADQALAIDIRIEIGLPIEHLGDAEQRRHQIRGSLRNASSYKASSRRSSIQRLIPLIQSVGAQHIVHRRCRASGSPVARRISTSTNLPRRCAIAGRSGAHLIGGRRRLLQRQGLIPDLLPEAPLIRRRRVSVTPCPGCTFALQDVPDIGSPGPTRRCHAGSPCWLGSPSPARFG